LFWIVGKLYQTLYLQISSHERAHTTAMVNESSAKARICKDIQGYAGRSFNLRSQQGNSRGTSIDKKSEAQLPRAPNAGINLETTPGDGLGSNCNLLNWNKWTPTKSKLEWRRALRYLPSRRTVWSISIM
jgi:hypothetical protein